MSGFQSPFLRLVFLPLCVAGFLILAHRLWENRKEATLEARRNLLTKTDTGFRLSSDSFFPKRIAPGAPRDPVELASRLSGWPIRKRGEHAHWQWGCLQGPDSGMVTFFSFDSGCATQHGAFWSDAMTIHWQSWDLMRKEGGPEHHTTSTRSIWSYPGDHRMCLPTRSDHPPDSVQALCEGRWIP